MPEPLATAQAVAADGARFTLRRHGNPEGPRLVLSHANGLAIDLYYPFWSLLAERFDLVLYDFRNHGWNPRSDVRNHNIAVFVSDNEIIAEAIDREFGKKPKIGVFHCLSALTALHERPIGQGFEALVLFDPPIYPPQLELLDTEEFWQRLGVGAARRKVDFRSRNELADRIRRAPVFGRLQPGVADLFAQTTLRAAPDDEGYVLCCPPECEAKVFEYALAYIFEPEPSSYSCPVKVIGGDPTAQFSFLPSRNIAGLTALEYDFVPDTTHFLQIENPGACVAAVLDFLERHGLG